jgi:benzodiazapine receptor
MLMKKYMPWLNLLAALGTIGVNILANALPFNGKSTASISDQFPVLFVPAGYVFAIWGVIYIGWLAFALYPLLPAQRNSPRLAHVGWLFALASVANAVWLFTWHYEQFPLSVVVMLALLALLIALYRRLNIGRVQVSRLEQWTVDIPFGVYLGWISVATIANISDLLYYWRWDGFGIAPEVWTLTMLLIAAALAGTMIVRRNESAYALVLVWAFVGIAVKQVATPSVANPALVLAALMGLMVVAGWFYRRRRRMTPISAAARH